MAAKKNAATQTPSEPTRQRRKAKADQNETAPTPAPPPAEPAAAATAEERTVSVREPSSTVPAMPAEGPTTTPADGPAMPPPAANQLSALEAAVRVLAETGQAMSCPELIAAMADKGYWRSPKGRTPHATLYASFLRELQTKGDDARFRKAGRGKFRLQGTR
jgi:hypothetical protein